MLSLAKRYHPITGQPFQRDETYWELPPCDALKPYIRCFWGSLHPVAARPQPEPGLVIPDTCMDVIFHIDYTSNRYTAAFCTLDEHSYRTGGCDAPQPCVTATFAIRFYAWTTALFARMDLTGIRNTAFDAEDIFRPLVAALRPLLFDVPGLGGKIAAAETFLLGQLEGLRPQPGLLNAVHCLIQSEGRARMNDLAGYAALSPRTLERLFQRHMGISPKGFASLVRYQLLWQSMVFDPAFRTLDAAERFGYTDQAHLLRDFRQRHLMNPKAALTFARADLAKQRVGFLQDKTP